MDEESTFGHVSSQAHPHAVCSRRTTDVRALLDTPTSACYTMLGPLHWPRLAATPASLFEFCVLLGKGWKHSLLGLRCSGAP